MKSRIMRRRGKRRKREIGKGRERKGLKGTGILKGGRDKRKPGTADRTEAGIERVAASEAGRTLQREEQR